MQTLSNLNRKQIRYSCFRLATEANGGAVAEGLPEGLKEHFEELPWFSGWKNYGITWDVSAETPLTMIPLKLSLEKAWEMEALGFSRELPKK